MKIRILAFLCAISLIAYVQRAALSVPLKEIGKDLELDDPTRSLGLLQSAWYFGYAFLQLPAGLLADRMGARRTIVLLSVLWSLATAATAFSRSYSEMLIAWTMMGILQAGIFPCAVRTISQYFGDHERARASGWLGAGSGAGAALAPLLTASLLNWFGNTEDSLGFPSWRICMALYGLPGILWAIGYWSCTTGIDSGQKSNEDSAVPKVDNTPSAEISALEVWKRMLLDRSLILLCSQQFLRASAMVFFISWFPTFLREARGVTQFNSGFLTSCAGIAGVLGIISGGYVSDALFIRTGNRRLARQGVAIAGMGTCAVLIVISYFIQDVNQAMVLISAGAFCASFGGVAGYTVAMEFGGSRVGTVFGAMNMAGNIGSMLFPVTVGWLVKATGTWNSALFLFAILMGVDAVLWAILNPKTQFMADADS